ncbi:MAG: hypothetical protein V1653_01780 [bacterium]
MDIKKLIKYFIIAFLVCNSVLALAEGLSIEKVFVVSCLKGQNVADQLAKNITADQTCIMYLAAETKEKGLINYYADIPQVKIDGRVFNTRRFPEKNKITVNWYKVEPEMYHTEGKGHDPDNPYFLWYTNTGVPGGKTDRVPLVIPDTIKYTNTGLDDLKNSWAIVADAHPTQSQYDVNKGLGVMRYSVAVEYKGAGGRIVTVESPNIKSYQGNGISNNVPKVIIRQDDSYIGYLTGYFNVPGVFGSYPYQVDNYIGVDCADLVVGAWKQFSGKYVKYTNVTGLRYAFVLNKLSKVSPNDHYLDSQGNIYQQYNASSDEYKGAKVIPISPESVNIGDVIVFNYSPKREDTTWDHTGVLFADSGEDGKPNGILDGHDLILHCGPAEPQVSPLGSNSFVSPDAPTRFAVLRWIK